jgi:hypothetical protein
MMQDRLWKTVEVKKLTGAEAHIYRLPSGYLVSEIEVFEDAFELEVKYVSKNSPPPKLSDAEVDKQMVDLVTAEMTKKLAQKRKEGISGWHTFRFTTEDLRKALREHVDKGDMVDVLNFAGMVLARERRK